MNLKHWVESASINSRSNSWSVYHEPPVSSVDGSNSERMYSFFVGFLTDLIDLIRFLFSRDLMLVLTSCVCLWIRIQYQMLLHVWLCFYILNPYSYLWSILLMPKIPLLPIPRTIL